MTECYKDSSGVYFAWRKSAVLEELIELASKRSNTSFYLSDDVGPTENILAPKIYYRDDILDRVAYEKDYGAIRRRKESPMENNVAFWDELERLQRIITKPLDEPILPDDYPLVQGYVYVANGKPRVFIDGERMTVGRWKELRLPDVEVITEVRRCDRFGRQLRLPPKKEKDTPIRQAWLERSSSNRLSENQKRRKPRNSNKIKKVK